MRIIKSGQFALVIDAAGEPNNQAGNDTSLHAADHGAGLCGHFVFDRFSVDDNGYIRLTSTLPIGDLYGCVEIVGAELESLLKQAAARYPAATPQMIDFNSTATD